MNIDMDVWLYQIQALFHMWTRFSEPDSRRIDC